MRLGRRGIKFTRRKPASAPDRQRLSFFFVVIFLAAFCIIVLAEIVFVDERSREVVVAAAGSGGAEEAVVWETPGPFLARMMAARQQQMMRQVHEPYQKNIELHSDEMETLIRNISAGMPLANAFKPRHALPHNTPSVPYSYPNTSTLPFDFTLRNHTGFDATWQPVAGSVHKFYVYSAYYDARSAKQRVVRVVGVTKTKRPEKVKCKLYYRGPTSVSAVATVPASTSVIRENWNLEFSAVFVLCPLPDARVPESVAVVASVAETADPGGGHPSNQLPVLNLNGSGAEAVNSTEVGVCVKPIHFNYSRKMELAQFIELNKLLGVTHFTLYNHTMSEEVSCMLKSYIDRGEVTVLQWNLDFKSQVEIRTEGLFAALNDCLYRSMNSFNYLALIDFDEFIVPHRHASIPDMIRAVDEANGKPTEPPMPVHAMARRSRAKVKIPAAYSFQNAFFYRQFPDDELAQDDDLGLLVLRKTRRKLKLNPHKQRSKYVCIPRRVKEVGNHFIWEAVEGGTINVSPDDGFLHHYRVCEFGGDDCVQAESKVDRTLMAYRDELVAAVRTVMTDVADRCGVFADELTTVTSSEEAVVQLAPAA